MLRTVVTALVVALALAAWLAWSALFAPDAPRVGKPRQSPGSTAAATGDRTPPPGALDRDASSREEVEAPGSAAAVGAAPTEGTFVLRIVRDLGDGSGDQPVPGAVVWRATAKDMNDASSIELQRLSSAGADAEMLARFWGVAATADLDGEVALPNTTERITVFATAGEWSGYREWTLRRGRPTTEPILRLQRSLTLHVKAVDPSGTPLPWIVITHGATAPDGSVQPWQRARTGTDGVAILRHAHLRGDREHDAALPTLVRASVAGQTAPVDATVPAGTLGAHDVELVLPATGTVRVSVDSVTGHGYPMFGTLIVTPIGEEPEHERGNHYLMGESSREFAVALGRRYRIDAHLDGVPMAREIAGPSQPDELVAVRFQVGDDTPLLRGRVVLEAPAAASREFLILDVATEAGLFNRAVPLEADGSFQCLLEPRLAGVENASCRLFLETKGSGPFEHTRPLPLLHVGAVDLGDVVLRQLPALVACDVRIDGRVPDVPPVVYLQQQQAVGAGGTEWRQTRLAKSYADGRLGFHGPDPRLPLQVVVADPRLAPHPPVPVAAGELRVALELSRGGDAALPVAGVEAIGQDLFARVTPDDGTTLRGERPHAVLRDPGADQVFRWQALAPGRYRVAVLTRESARPLAERVGLEVRAGETVEWPLVDLADATETARVRVSIEGGPAERALLVPRDPALGALMTLALDDGIATLTVPAGQSVGVDVVALGCTARSVEVRAGDQTVDLQRHRHGLRFALDPDLLVDVPGATWTITAWPAADTAADGDDPSGIAATTAMAVERAGLAWGDLAAQVQNIFRATADENGLGALRLPSAGGWTLKLLGTAVAGDRDVSFSHTWPQPFDAASGTMLLQLPAAARARARSELGR